MRDGWHRGERIHPLQAPIAQGGREYTRYGHQPQKGRENIPVWANERWVAPGRVVGHTGIYTACP
eukprot:5291790-Pyramimonas_sp.AAC.1